MRWLESLPLAVTLGAIGGALFGVFFGAFASVFEGGPASAAVGIAESWAWFAAVGMAIAFGMSRAARADRAQEKGS